MPKLFARLHLFVTVVIASIAALFFFSNETLQQQINDAEDLRSQLLRDIENSANSRLALEEDNFRLQQELASLSLQIANLEETLALKLVERGRAGAVLTPEGREVLARARRILDDVAALAETSEQMKTGLG